MKAKLLRLLVVMTISITALFALGMTASAATAGDFTITLTEGGGEPTDGVDYAYDIATGVLAIKSETAMTIANTNPSTSTTDKIKVADGVSANITLAGININVSGSDYATAFEIADDSTGNVTITLADGTTNTLKSGYQRAGLQKNGTSGSLEIKGTGTLEASGGELGAGIGSGNEKATANITISGGIINATGKRNGAGIGSGSGSGSASDIIISGGIVTATGGNNGAGIGGGSACGGRNIKISGGTITAIGGESGAGIGGGSACGSGSNIIISGGTITAQGGDYGAGIGGGNGGSGYDIKISGGSVKAVAGTGANAIGGGNGKSAVTPTNGTNNVYLLELISATTSLEIDGKAYPINHGTDGKVYVYLTEGEHTIEKDGGAGTTAYYAKNADNKLEAIGTAFTITGTDLVLGTDYTYPADTGVLTILSDKDITIANTNPSTSTTDRIEVATGVSAKITLAGVNIDVSTLNETAAAFKIADSSTGNVTITLADGTTNTLKSGEGCAALQKNGSYISETQGKLTITGTGSLTATGGYEGAGIGGGLSGGSNIIISGGTITAIGGESGAGIGAGWQCSGSNIKISGGTITAIGGESGAGIGGGFNGSGSNITISGGSVKAVAGTNANAIGGGNGQSAETPTDGSNDVYLLTIANPNSEDVTIDGAVYTPQNHTSADSNDTNLYVYLPAKTAEYPNEVTVGNKTTKYCYINAKWITVVDAPFADLTEFIYDGTEKTYTIRESAYYSISGNKQTNAGTYTVTLSLNDKENTVWGDSTTDDKNYRFTIKKADISTPISDVEMSFYYDETGEQTATVSGLPVGMGTETPAIQITDANGIIDANSVVYGQGRVRFTLIGFATETSGISATIKVTLSTQNYNDFSFNVIVNITEKNVQTVTASDVTLTYGDTNGKVTATTDGDGEISYEVATGEDVISVDTNGNITILKAGTATVTVKAAETFDYAEATKTIFVTVNKKKIAVPAADTTEYTYTGLEQNYGVTSTADYTVEGGVQTNAGEYPITITLNDENYEWDGTLGTYKFVINKAEVTVTAKSYTIKVGEALPSYAYDVTGLVNGETLPINVTISCASDGKTAGTFDIVVSGDAASDNYTFAYVNGTLTVSAKAVQTVTASDVTLTYGDTDGKITATTDGDGAISYEVATGADVISVAADGTITVLKAGTATVTVKAAETDTYAAATKTVTVTVNKAAATITAKSYTINVGEALPSYAYDVTGLVNGETLPIDVTISCTADGKTAGTFDIVVSGDAESTNYTFSYVNGTLTVSEMEVVAAPTFNPANGTTFKSTLDVTIACATEGAKIYYTTDGTAPTTASTLYNGAITINKTTTIKAIAVKDGMADSAVVTASYTKKSTGSGGGGGYTPSRPSTPIDPEIGGKSASWATIASDIAKLPIGSVVTIQLNGNYSVPVDVIKAIADRDVKVTFIADSARSWYVEGVNITAPVMADLRIITIASLNADTLRGEAGAKFLMNSTNIPTELKLTFAKNNAGKFANLFKKDGDKLVFVDNAKINADGTVMLDAAIAGDYVAMLCEFSDRNGDASNDGITNAMDAAAILKVIVDLEDCANPVMLDYNGDGMVNALDASALLKDIVNGKI